MTFGQNLKKRAGAFIGYDPQVAGAASTSDGLKKVTENLPAKVSSSPELDRLVARSLRKPSAVGQLREKVISDLPLASSLQFNLVNK